MGKNVQNCASLIGCNGSANNFGKEPAGELVTTDDEFKQFREGNRDQRSKDV